MNDDRKLQSTRYIIDNHIKNMFIYSLATLDWIDQQ